MQKKHNFSVKREAIYKTISSTDIHPSAEWIYEQLKPSLPDLSLGTVYRNLAVFKQNGMIQSLGVINGQERFDWNMSKHSHFICEKCFSVMDIPADRNLIEPSVYGFVEEHCHALVRTHNIVFYGLCSRCRQENQECQYLPDNEISDIKNNH